MKKGVIAIFLVLIVLSFASAANETDSAVKIDKAYKCLEDQIKAKDSFSLQESIFGLLAEVSDKKLEKEIESEKKTGEACWPKSACNIKETAQVLLAYDRSGKETEEIKNWLLSKTFSVKDLAWYLEIDIESHEASDCSITYDSRENKINIKTDMTLTGNPGGCFEIAYGGYWLKIKEACLDKEFEISCNDESEGNFITTLVYQEKSGEGTVYVSSETHSSAKGGTTTEKVNSKCFGTGNKCNYEGTLWATLVLESIGEDTSIYIPYLTSLSKDNEKYFPSAFLLYLTGGEEEYSRLIEKQKAGGYWSIVGSSYGKFYDTALGMLALGGKDESNSAKNYLLGVQTKEGCWNNNNIRDTGFILYAGWAREGKRSNPSTPQCISAGYFCEAKSDCLSSFGNVIDGYLCESFKTCCSKKVVLPSCNEKGGVVCSLGENCFNGRFEPSFESNACCVGGGCVEEKPENICEDVKDGTCRSSGCFEDEVDTGDECPDSSDICCVETGITPPDPIESNYLPWIIALIILIVLLLIGIVYRRKIQMWWFSRKRGKSGPSGRGIGPRGPPPGMMMRMMPRYGPPGQRGPMRGGPAPRLTTGVKSPQDKEMEETMKKLKEMSK